MRKTVAFNIGSRSFDDLPPKWDLVLTALGYETRARFLTERLKLRGTSNYAIAFPDRQVLSFDDNRRYFTEAGFEIKTVIDAEFKAAIGEIVDRLAESEKDELLVCVDISSFSRYRLAHVVSSLLQRSYKCCLRIFFMYNVASFSPPDAPSMGANSHAGPVTADFAGWRPEPDAPPVAAVGLGYEEGKALGAVEYLQADEIWAFDPFSPLSEYRDELTKANALLLEACPPSRVVQYDLTDPVGLFYKLESVVYGIKRSGRPIILPFGPKLFTLISLLVAYTHPEAAVWRVSAGDTEPASDRLPSDISIVLEVCLRK